MKTYLSIYLPLALAISILVGFRAPSDDVRTFSLRNFDKVDLGSAFTIRVQQGNTFTVRASGRSQDLDELDATVTDNTLKIRYRDSGWGTHNRKQITIDVTMPALRSMRFSGASTATVGGFRQQGRVSVDVKGASTATLNLDATELDVDFSGASTVNLNGRVNGMAGIVSGATTLRAYNLQARQADLKVSGASTVHVSASDRLSLVASGASSVRYRGGASVNSNTSGASSVRRDD